MIIKKLKGNLGNDNHLIVVAVFLLLVLFIIAFLAINNFSMFDKSPQITPRPTEEIKKDLEAFENQTEEKEVEHPIAGNISLIHDQTPYAGRYFTLIYSEDDYYFYYYIDPNNSDAGNRELDEFLMKYGIPERSLFEGLNESKTPLPTPEP